MKSKLGRRNMKSHNTGEDSNIHKYSTFKVITKRPWKFFIFVIVITLLIPIIFFGIPFNFIPTKQGIEPSDWLEFLGGFFSFIGTLFLGVVAIYQNEKLLDINKGLQNLERERFNYEKQMMFSYLGQHNFEYFNDSKAHYNGEHLGLIINFPEGGIKHKEGDDYKELPILKFDLNCISDTPIQHIHITNYDLEIKSNFGSYKINRFQNTEIQKDKVSIYHVDDCCLQKGDHVPLLIRFYNVKLKKEITPQIQSVNGKIYFECSSLYNMSSFSFLKFEIGLKNHENPIPLRPLEELCVNNIRMIYAIESNRQTSEDFYLRRL